MIKVSSIASRLSALHDWAVEKPYVGVLVRAGDSGLKNQDRDSAAGITSVIVLMWSASKMVGALSRAINRSLGMKRNFAVYLSPLRYFGLTLVVALPAAEWAL